MLVLARKSRGASALRTNHCCAGRCKQQCDELMIERPQCQEALERRITQLQAVHESEDSWQGVVKGGDPDNFCTGLKPLRFDRGLVCFCA